METPTRDIAVRPTTLFSGTGMKTSQLTFVPEGHQKAVKQAFYNAAALVFVALLVGGAIGVYYVLESFIQPLYWALIFGSFLHPSKRLLTSVVREWLKEAKKDEQTLSVSLCLLPFGIIERSANYVYETVIAHWRLILIVLVALPVAQIVYYFGASSLSFLMQLLAAMEYVYTLLDVPARIAGAIVCGYFVVVFAGWQQQAVRHYAPICAPVIWIIILRSLCVPRVFGAFSYPLFALVGGVILFGAIHDWAVRCNFSETVSFYGHVLLELLPLPLGDKSNTDCTDGEGEGESEAEATAPAMDTTVQGGEADSTIQTGHPAGNQAEAVKREVSHEFDVKPAMESTGLKLFASPIESDAGVATLETPRRNRYLKAKVTFSENAEPKLTPIEPCDVPDHVAKCSTAETDKRRLRVRSVSAYIPATRSGMRDNVPLRRRHSLRFSRSATRKSSHLYFVALFWAMVLTQLWNQLWLLAKLVPVCCLILLVKYVWDRLRAGARLRILAASACTAAADWLAERQAVFLPFASLRNASVLLGRLDALVLSLIDANIDYIVTAFLIVVLIIMLLIGTIFLFLQIQNESGHLVTEVTTVVNNVLSIDLPLISGNSQSEYLKTLLDGAISNAYSFVKKWMTEKLDVLLASTTTNQTARAEIQQKLTDLFDRLANMSVTAFANGSKFNQEKSHLVVAFDWETNATYSQRLMSLMPDVGQLWQALDLSQLLAFVNDNLEFLTSLLKSVWLILRGNLEIVFTFLTASLWMVLSGGTALVNMVLKTLVFFSGLYYLLAFSHQTYIPVRWITHLTESADAANRRTPDYTASLNITHDFTKRPQHTVPGFYSAFERAVNGVFLCSLKMGTFYGMYTWLTHTLFGSNLVYIPVVFAAILAAVPFIGTYWASLPASLEIAFIRQEPLVALFFFLIHLAPSYFVDIAFYSEIEGGGHPYLTGLAIAGGVYCFGLEGAIVGPILLCCMLVAVHVYSAVLSSSETTTY